MNSGSFPHWASSEAAPQSPPKAGSLPPARHRAAASGGIPPPSATVPPTMHTNIFTATQQRSPQHHIDPTATTASSRSASSRNKSVSSASSNHTTGGKKQTKTSRSASKSRSKSTSPLLDPHHHHNGTTTGPLSPTTTLFGTTTTANNATATAREANDGAVSQIEQLRMKLEQYNKNIADAIGSMGNSADDFNNEQRQQSGAAFVDLDDDEDMIAGAFPLPASGATTMPRQRDPSTVEVSNNNSPTLHTPPEIARSLRTELSQAYHEAMRREEEAAAQAAAHQHQPQQRSSPNKNANLVFGRGGGPGAPASGRMSAHFEEIENTVLLDDEDEEEDDEVIGRMPPPVVYDDDDDDDEDDDILLNDAAANDSDGDDGMDAMAAAIGDDVMLTDTSDVSGTAAVEAVYLHDDDDVEEEEEEPHHLDASCSSSLSGAHFEEVDFTPTFEMAERALHELEVAQRSLEVFRGLAAIPLKPNPNPTSSSRGNVHRSDFELPYEHRLQSVASERDAAMEAYREIVRECDAEHEKHRLSFVHSEEELHALNPLVNDIEKAKSKYFDVVRARRVAILEKEAQLKQQAASMQETYALLDDRRRALNRKEAELAARKSAFIRREEDLQARERQLDAQLEAVDAKEKDVEAKEDHCKKWIRILEGREERTLEKEKAFREQRTLLDVHVREKENMARGGGFAAGQKTYTTSAVDRQAVAAAMEANIIPSTSTASRGGDAKGRTAATNGASPIPQPITSIVQPHHESIVRDDDDDDEEDL